MLALDAPLIPDIPAAAQLKGQAASAGARRGLLQRHRCSGCVMLCFVVLP
jgi:hypothetical protein